MANRYDRVFQENFRGLTVPLINRIMNVQHVELVSLPRKIQRTLEREMDGLVKVILDSGHPVLVNLEWQTVNDPKMCLRMLLYHALSAIVHNLPVLGVVIYIGKEKLNMSDQLVSDNLKYKFRLIDMTKSQPELFLESNIPEEVIMAILAGTPDLLEKRKIIKKILYKLRLLLRHDESELNRRIAQFEIIGELRNVQHIIIQEEKNMALTYNIENDIRYNQGIEKGIEKGIEIGKTILVKSLLRNTTYSVEEIAGLAGLQVEVVDKVKKQIL